MRSALRHALILAAIAAGPCTLARDDSIADGSAQARRLDAVVVHGTGLRGVPAFDAPASLDVVVPGDDSRAQVLASELLAGLPGVLARERQNQAQDTQLSIRGFGARSTFGVRGLRLYTDGIPATMPDGQGQLAHFVLAGAERLEVLRGPFSALHGNASGGVVELHSADGQPDDPWRLRTTLGSHGSWTAAANLRGGSDAGGYNLALVRFGTSGFRGHGAARRDQLNLKLHRLFDGDRRLDVVLNHLDLPHAQDPLGLTRAQFEADPRQAAPVAHQFDTRKSVRQPQLGLRWQQPLGTGGTLEARAWAGAREVEQYLPVPAAAQANPLHAGGVIDLDNRYGGLDLRWTWRGELAGRAVEFTAGTGADAQRQHRRGHENFLGLHTGVRGALRRDEHNRTGTADRYTQLWWQAGERWSLLLGARHSAVRFRSDDHYVTADNPDDSGRVRHARTVPVAGLVIAPQQDVRLHVAAGRGFETPTFNELSYRADGGAGLAFDLRPAVSDHAELGLKWRRAGGLLEAALFRADTRDELAVVRNAGGRSSYGNVGRARREGAELAWSQDLGDTFTLRLAATWLDARFREGFRVCPAAGCTVPDTPVPAGSRIPGVAPTQGHLRLAWGAGPWQAAVEASATGNVKVADVGGERAPGHALLNLEAGRSVGDLRAFLRVDNILDRRHVGSVIVNDGNGRYYEPGPGRTWLAGLEWRWQR